MRILTALVSIFLASSAVAAERPNFVIIYVDDLGWADTSVRMLADDPDSASDFHQTPHLEKLAARGTIFSQAYAPSPTCSPSRFSIQFGKTPAKLGYTFVHDVLALERKIQWEDKVSLADVLKAADPNYVTAHFGKGIPEEQLVHLGYDVTDETDGKAPNGNFHGEYVSLKDRTPLPADDPKRMASLEEVSVSFIEKHSGKRPFFMMVSHYAVHVPHKARADLIEKYRNLPRGKHLKDDDYLPVEQMKKGKVISSWRLQYAAMLEQLDEGLGAIVDAIEKSGQLDNTYIIFTSDNGGGLGPNGPLRGGKANLYEGGLRVPFVVAGPRVRAGARCAVPVAQWDLLPTLHDCSRSGRPLPENLDGGSLREVFENGDAGKVERPVECFVFHYPCYFAPPLSVIRLGDYKFMEHHLTGEQRLYDLASDLGEEKNLIATKPMHAAELKAVMDRYLKSVDAEDVQDVYAARFRELDRFEAGARRVHTQALKRADGDAEAIAEADKKLAAHLERFQRNRAECRENMRGTTF